MYTYCCTETVLPSIDHFRTEEVLPPSDHSCIETVSTSGDQYCIDIVVPSSDHCCTVTVPQSSDHVAHRTYLASRRSAYAAGARAWHVCNASQERVTGRRQELPSNLPPVRVTPTSSAGTKTRGARSTFFRDLQKPTRFGGGGGGSSRNVPCSRKQTQFGGGGGGVVTRISRDLQLRNQVFTPHLIILMGSDTHVYEIRLK